MTTMTPDTIIPASGNVPKALLREWIRAQEVSDIAALKNIPVASAPKLAYVANHTTGYSGGGGMFIWDSASVVADNNGTVIIPASGGTGRWLRVFEEGSASFNARWFGAFGDGVADDTVALQAAITATPTNGTLLIPNGTYLVTPQTHAALSGVFGANSVCLQPKSSINIEGQGFGTVLKLKNSSTGASGAIIGNPVTPTISDFVLKNIMLDGNKGSTSGTISGLLLSEATDCEAWRVKSINSSFVGIMMRNAATTRCKVTHCTVKDSDNIGIQMQFAVGCEVAHNTVTGSGDNAIDFEADSSTMQNNSIALNTILTISGHGIFLESGGGTNVNGNVIDGVGSGKHGVFLNQITTPSLANNINANRLKGGASAGSAIYVNNNSGGSIVIGNYIELWDYGVFSDVGVNIGVGKNFFASIRKQLIGVERAANKLIGADIDRQVYTGARNASSGRPFTCSPLSNANNSPTRDSLVSIEPAFFTASGVAATLADEYTRQTGSTATNGAWSGAYSIFFAGETLVYTITCTPDPGDYATINGTLFKVHSRSGNEFAVRSFSNVAGNYTATTNGNHAITVHYGDWQDA